MKILCWFLGHDFKNYYMVKMEDKKTLKSWFKIDFMKCERCGFETK